MASRRALGLILSACLLHVIHSFSPHGTRGLDRVPPLTRPRTLQGHYACSHSRGRAPLRPLWSTPEEFNDTEPDTSNPGPARSRRDDSLLQDIQEMKRERGGSNAMKGAGQESEGPALKKAINILGTILTFNFVIIISFFLWFATGCVLKFGFENDVVIDAFTSKWDLIILPLLSTHMGLTFLSAGLERIAGVE